MDPRLAWEDDQLRVVLAPTGAVVEVAVSRDALGLPVWRRVSTQDPEAAALKRASGWKEICAELGLEPHQWRQAHEAARRRVDPLPVDYDPWGRPCAFSLAIRAWVHRNTLPARAHDLVRRADRPARSRAGSAA